MSIVDESPGFLQVFSDGSVNRFSPGTIDAFCGSYTNGYKSKDVIIDPTKNLTGRIFIPDVKSESKFLPIVVYFHGGGFCIGSTTWLGYHFFLGDLSGISKSIVLSVDYRLAPENKLPAAYDDCCSSLEWLCNNATLDPWLQRADLSRVFLSGDSAGGNIVHQVATRSVRQKFNGLEIKGLIPIHPYFGSEKRTELELAPGSEGHVHSNDMFWRLSLPEGQNRDYFGCNFENTELSEEEWREFCPAVLVFVAGLDFLKERGVMYADFLKKKGVKEVKLIEAEEESHVFNIFHPESDATRLLQKTMSDFIQDC
ncbi:OLC1v1032883C1 [Oldenlandia corymbosa var. corymbosa]|uniref:OLC1v1032883C1 n=1 Tax=Oldenlandia corymbosa var. corymbosa TaxID=529605 RepID=A0AAV1CMB0_OLDCO|nr:OLC1v1032883C1 [Oldenlandia corymbosa var. corymbosa]